MSPIIGTPLIRSTVEYRTKDFIIIDDFQVFSSFSGTLVRFSIKIEVLALTDTKSLCLVLLRPVEISLMLWLYRNGFIKRAALFCSCRHLSQNN